VGKTTLIKQLFDSIENKCKLFFDLENPLDQKVFEDIDYKNIFLRLKSMMPTLTNATEDRLYIFVDEIQNYPEITRVIKYLIDHYSVKFVVTGSSNFYLKNLFPEPLSGRKFVYQLNPLSFKEFLYFRDAISEAELQTFTMENALKPKDVIEYKKFEVLYDEFLMFGSYPEVVLTPSKEVKTEVLRHIFKSFFEKDLKILSNSKDIRELRDLILLLVPRVGSKLDVTKLSLELGVPRIKIYSFLEFLEGTFFINLVSRYSKSIDKAVAAGKKVYFSDTGLLRIIGNVNDGQVFENSVFNQLKEYGDISFYDQQNKSEIDFILNKKLAFEVKLTGTQAAIEETTRKAATLSISNSYVISKNFKENANLVYPAFL